MDRIKEELACLRVVFTLCVLINVSLLGWLAQNVAVASSLLLWLATGLACLFTVGIAWTGRVIFKKLGQME